MEISKLSIRPYKGKVVEVPLYEEPQPFSLSSALKYNNYYVYDDKSYEFGLDNSSEIIQSLTVYINGEDAKGYYNPDSNTVSFYSNNNGHIFNDRFGFVSISLLIGLSERKIWRYSGYISVLISDEINKKRIQSMIDYVYNHHSELLINSVRGEKIPVGLKDKGNRDIEVLLAMAEDIYTVYSNNFGYFRMNARFTTATEYAIDDIEKLQNVDYRTLEYISLHPALLRRTENVGIQINGHRYVPQKTLVKKSVYTCDTFENRVVVDFLYTLKEQLLGLQAEVNELLEGHKKVEEKIAGYYQSVYLFYKATIGKLGSYKFVLDSLIEKIHILIEQYDNILPVTHTRLNKAPRATSIFKAVPQYRVIYQQIVKWFSYGLYNFEDEKFMMSFMDGSSLYETYVLAKIIQSLEEDHYTLINSFKYNYHMHKASKYVNTRCNNTFIFEKGESTVTLYYQPVIFDGHQEPVNGLSLYRNNTLQLRDFMDFHSAGGAYYTPDYIIKRTDADATDYYILDAKYSNRSSVINNQLVNVVFKYLVSISEVSEENVDALYLIYGKADEEDHFESLYDSQIPNQTIHPQIGLIPITAGTNEGIHIQDLIGIIK
jgi:hypothetical protein